MNILTEFCEKFGSAAAIFPMVAIMQFTKFNYVEESYKISFLKGPLILIGLYYFIFLFLTDKTVIEWIKNLPSKLFGIFSDENIGIIVANQAPNIVVAIFKSNSLIKINDLVLLGKILTDKEGRIKKENADKVAIVLDFIGMESELDSVTVRLYLLNEPQRDLNDARTGLIKVNSECRIIQKAEEFIAYLESDKITYYYERRDDIIGLVSFDASIEILNSDIVRHKQLENAELVSVINNTISDQIRYQIIEAETKRETQEEKKDYGYTKLTAYQLGEWRKPKGPNGKEIENRFHQFFGFQWTPQINSVVLKWNKVFDEKNISETGVDKTGYFNLGKIPKTELPIYLRIKDIVSHHTAILGVTGSGKSTLVFKLIKAIFSQGIFILCIDITGEYKSKLKDGSVSFASDGFRTGWSEAIKKTNETEIEKAINELVKNRITEIIELKKVAIFELMEISNTKGSLDFIHYLFQAILKYAKGIYDKNLNKDEGQESDNFQSCIVLEEAHTLIPENTGIAGDFGASKAVIEKISQIALQGRKYNVGFLLISQRTATVKKTVLNQCNTMISFRAYDETSFNFLSSYYGEKYVKEITHLKNDGDSRYIIVAGKAVVADRPVIVEITEL